MFTHNKHFFTFGGFTFAATNFGKNPSFNASVRVHAVGHTNGGKLKLVL